MTTIWVQITATKGSAPRDAGTAMQVTAETTQGTIGGGALEHQAIATARQMLESGADDLTRKVPLGPGLGQCCGGAVELLFSRSPRRMEIESPPPRRLLGNAAQPMDLWVWGAGHVGRAVVEAAHPQAFSITWVDDADARFPGHIPGHAKKTLATNMPLLAQHAPEDAHHLIFTYSHDIDLALSADLLERGAAFIGLIGSDTKRARFFKRLRAMGLDPAPITCPIGDKSLGKHPRAIAEGTLRALLDQTEWKTSA